MSAETRLSNGLDLAALGRRARAARAHRHLSLDEVAELSGVSRSMVSEIERGRKVPTIVVLDRIAAALGTSVARLVQAEEPTQVVVRRADAHHGADDPTAPQRRVLAPALPGVEFDFMRTTLAPHSDAGTWLPHGEGSREYVAVESGRLVLTVDGADHVLAPGDSAFLDGDCSHSYRNPGSTECVYYLVLDLCDVRSHPRRHR